MVVKVLKKYVSLSKICTFLQQISAIRKIAWLLNQVQNSGTHIVNLSFLIAEVYLLFKISLLP